jgi:hypothetical protein
LLPSVQVKAQSETPEAKKGRARGMHNLHDGSNKSGKVARDKTGIDVPLLADELLDVYKTGVEYNTTDQLGVNDPNSPYSNKPTRTQYNPAQVDEFEYSTKEGIEPTPSPWEPFLGPRLPLPKVGRLAKTPKIPMPELEWPVSQVPKQMPNTIKNAPIKKVAPRYQDKVRGSSNMTPRYYNLGGVISTGLGITSQLAELLMPLLQREFQPAVQNQNPYGSFNDGGDIPIDDHAEVINGNPGIDTNQRMAGQTPINISTGEILRQDLDGGHYVFSDNPDMIHPDSNQTFAKTMAPIEKQVGKIRKEMKNNPYDAVAKSSLRNAERLVQLNKDKEEQLRAAKQQSIFESLQNMLPQANNSFYIGGPTLTGVEVKGNKTPGFQEAHANYLKNLQIPNDGWFTPSISST